MTRAWLQQLPQTFSTIWLSRSHSLIFSLSLSLSFSLVSRSILSRRTNRRHIVPVCTTQLKSVECERYVWIENVEQEKAKPFKYSSSTSNIFRFLLHSLPKIGNYEFDIFFHRRFCRPSFVHFNYDVVRFHVIFRDILPRDDKILRLREKKIQYWY